MLPATSPTQRTPKTSRCTKLVVLLHTLAPHKRSRIMGILHCSLYTPGVYPFTQSRLHADEGLTQSQPKAGEGRTPSSGSSLGTLCALLFGLCREVFPSTLAQSTASALFAQTTRVALLHRVTGTQALLQSRFQHLARNQAVAHFFAKTTGVGEIVWPDALELEVNKRTGIDGRKKIEHDRPSSQQEAQNQTIGRQQRIRARPWMRTNGNPAGAVVQILGPQRRVH